MTYWSAPWSSYVQKSLKSSIRDHIWSQKGGVSGENISIGSFHASFHNVSTYVKWLQKLEMVSLKIFYILFCVLWSRKWISIGTVSILASWVQNVISSMNEIWAQWVCGIKMLYVLSDWVFYSYFLTLWKIEAFSLCMFLLLPNLWEVPHGTKGTGPRFVTRPAYLRS